jgi:hypothetical protein
VVDSALSCIAACETCGHGCRIDRHSPLIARIGQTILRAVWRVAAFAPNFGTYSPRHWLRTCMGPQQSPNHRVALTCADSGSRHRGGRGSQASCRDKPDQAGARARLTPGLLLVAAQCAVRLYWRKAATSTDWSLSEGIVMSMTYFPVVPPTASAAAAESCPSSLT